MEKPRRIQILETSLYAGAVLSGGFLQGRLKRNGNIRQHFIYIHTYLSQSVYFCALWIKFSPWCVFHISLFQLVWNSNLKPGVPIAPLRKRPLIEWELVPGLLRLPHRGLLDYLCMENVKETQKESQCWSPFIPRSILKKRGGLLLIVHQC